MGAVVKHLPFILAEEDSLLKEIESTITFKWNPYSFAAGANGSYRVSLIQYTAPFPVLDQSPVVLRQSHHWAEATEGTQVTMGPFGFYQELICAYCPTVISIEPETYQLVYNKAIDSYEYVYTLLGGAPSQQSSPFVTEIFRPEVECIHFTDDFQPYYVRDPNTNACICTLTDDICADVFAAGEADLENCTCKGYPLP